MPPRENSYSGWGIPPHARPSRLSLAARIVRIDFGGMTKLARSALRSVPRAFATRNVMPNPERAFRTKVEKAPRTSPSLGRVSTATAASATLARRLTNPAGKTSGGQSNVLGRPGRDDTHASIKAARRDHAVPDRTLGEPLGAARRAFPLVPSPLPRLRNSNMPDGSRTAVITAAPRMIGAAQRPRNAGIAPIAARVRSALERVRVASRLRADAVARSSGSSAAIRRASPLGPASRLIDRVRSATANRVEQAVRRARPIAFTARHAAFSAPGAAGNRGSAPLPRGPEGSPFARNSCRGWASRADARSRESGHIMINYAPTVTVNGGADIGDIDSLIVEAMRRHGHELALVIRREAAVRRRAEF